MRTDRRRRQTDGALAAEAHRRPASLPPERPLPAVAVRQILIECLKDSTGRDSDWQVEGPLIKARQAYIYRAHCPLAPWPIAVKAFTSEVALGIVEQQAERLARYHKAMSKATSAPREFTVPAMWAVLPEHRMVLMEWVEERRMDRLLWWSGPRRQRRAQIITAAGCWLRHFHQHCADMRPAPLLSERLAARLGTIALPNQRTGRPADPVFRCAYDVICHLAPQFAGMLVDHAEPHGDFVPHNLLHGSGRTVGLDFKSRPRAAFAQDLFHFLIQAEIEKPFLTRRADIGEWGLERQDQVAFLSGYGPLAQLGDDRLMKFLMLVQVSRRWHTHTSRRTFPVLSHIKTARLRRIAAAVIASLDGSTLP